MEPPKSPNRMIHFSMITMLILYFMYTLGCIGGGGDGGPGVSEISLTSDGIPAGMTWNAEVVKQLESTGLLSPNVKALSDNEGKVHLAYFDGSGNNDGTYNVHYMVLDDESTDQANHTEEIIANVDNCLSLGFTIDEYDFPVVVYRGGAVRECGTEQQSDVMFSLRENAIWQEYTGAIGYVDRNPVFKDGLAGTNVSLAFDSNRDLHISYQFLYEGCDSMNFQYPDLYYIKKPRTDLNDTGNPEVQVEGNTYNNGTLNIQNRAGDHNTIVIDRDDNPVIFYYAELEDNTRGLRMARRQLNGTWQKQWIETGCEIGGISASMKPDGRMGVAYYVTSYTDGRDDEHLLKYAQEGFSSWTIQVVDNWALCGKYPSLSFDSEGHPAVVYYEIQTYSGYQLRNLKFARYDGSGWNEDEVVAWIGDIGLYNTLLFDDNDRPVIYTFSNTEKAIYRYYLE